jgi:hypothetical protein
MAENTKMTNEEKEQLNILLDKLAQEKCYTATHPGTTCDVDCIFYINGAYGGECALGIVQDNI